VKAGCGQKEEERPVKKLRADVNVSESVNVDDSAAAYDGEHQSFFVDLTASDDVEQIQPASSERLSDSKDLPFSLPDTCELCLTQDNCACGRTQQLCSVGHTISSPPASPKLLVNVDDSSHCQSVNSICDVASLKMQYRNAIATVDTNSCDDDVTDELMNDCHDDVIQTNGLPLLEPQVARVVVNGGSVVHDC